MKSFNEMLMPDVRDKAIKAGFLDNPKKDSDNKTYPNWIASLTINNLQHKKKKFGSNYIKKNKLYPNTENRIILILSSSDFYSAPSDSVYHDQLLIEMYLRGYPLTENDFKQWYYSNTNYKFIALLTQGQYIFPSESYDDNYQFIPHYSRDKRIIQETFPKYIYIPFPSGSSEYIDVIEKKKTIQEIIEKKENEY